MSIASIKTGSEPADIETSSDDYARRFSGAAGAWMLERQSRIVLELLGDHRGASVLDVGGGHGQIAVPMMSAGHRVTVHGSDERCASRIKPHVEAGRMAFIASSMFALPFADRSFDFVTCIRLLPHSPEWARLIGELCRVAQHAVIVDYPAWRSINVISGAMFGLKKKVEGNTRPFRLFTHGEVSRAFASGDFSIDRKRGQYVFPMAVHRMMNNSAVSSAIEGLSCGIGLTRLLGSPVLARAVRRHA